MITVEELRQAVLDACRVAEPRATRADRETITRLRELAQPPAPRPYSKAVVVDLAEQARAAAAALRKKLEEVSDLCALLEATGDAYPKRWRDPLKPQRNDVVVPVALIVPVALHLHKEKKGAHPNATWAFHGIAASPRSGSSGSYGQDASWQWDTAAEECPIVVGAAATALLAAVAPLTAEVATMAMVASGAAVAQDIPDFTPSVAADADDAAEENVARVKVQCALRDAAVELVKQVRKRWPEVFEAESTTGS